ncbi:hypothetical protein GCM10009550_77640 [Actinocorallia libanotica]|uniref:Uncharacterized protein n=1 Tax=Actinocorallia libanotica TaxID=46162 RepID=A0ABN1S1Q3_9ACTN
MARLDSRDGFRDAREPRPISPLTTARRFLDPEYGPEGARLNPWMRARAALDAFVVKGRSYFLVPGAVRYG